MRRNNWTIARFVVIAFASFGAIAPVAQALAGVPGNVN